MNTRPLTEQEKKTLRLGGAVLALGLALAAVLWCVRHLQARRIEYHRLLVEAQDVRDEIDLYQDKAGVAQKLMVAYQLDPMRLNRSTLIAQASAAIQKTAQDSGVASGTIRESPAHGSGKEIASIQFEGVGEVASVMTLLHQLERAGVPLIVESVQISPGTQGPGKVKVNLSVVVLDFDQWKKEGGSGA